MRCLAYIVVDYYFPPYILMNPCLAQISHFPPVVHKLVLGTIRCVFLASGLIWMTSLMTSWITTWHSKKGETIKKNNNEIKYCLFLGDLDAVFKICSTISHLHLQ
ncbi:hypothetical protein CEXT_665151 [Caerostris extrusa]|uniref:Uncharacterized protein n=1 Tax=Caerostris extrusa TaxID=172846 RepID=A0AAV4RJV9_CAEEX|nr:hypothetical protein CEXT_665151 [Caerostris extrusa]